MPDTAMSVVIDEAVEQAMLQLAESRQQVGGTPILELDALLRDGDGVNSQSSRADAVLRHSQSLPVYTLFRSPPACGRFTYP